jgi:hypothetical protein
MATANSPQELARSIASLSGPAKRNVKVQLSHELVNLLSEQLYQSPLKAIEELVINSYDAGAHICRVYVPSSAQIASATLPEFISVFDDGEGLSDEGMTSLWHIGRSPKTRAPELDKLKARRQIGKFGIGKLATYTVAGRLTYISRTADGILTTSIDFSRFQEDPTGPGAPVEIPVLAILDLATLKSHDVFSRAVAKSGISDDDLSKPTWTFVILEGLKDKANQIRSGRLHWVLRTAMPLKLDFRLYLNGEEVKSAKLDYDVIVSFTASDLPLPRLKALNDKTGDNWRAQAGRIVSDTFSEGVSGTVIVTRQTLPGKSDDVLRSNGFFIRIRGRLLEHAEPFFGMPPVHHGTLNRFRADIDADDLDATITAPRETIGASKMRDLFESLLGEIFAEARSQYEAKIELEEIAEKRKKEQFRSFVSAGLVEYPIATALVNTSVSPGNDADNTWLYLDVPKTASAQEVAKALFNNPRTKFQYTYAGYGKEGHLVRFDPSTATFTINSDHDFVAANVDEPRAQMLLEDILTAEVLLEVQLLNAKVSPQVIGEVLQARDTLLKSLALDHPYSPVAVAKQLRDAASDEHDLEIALVAAARTLGFVAKHISGAGEPDGVARYVEYPKNEVTITLEAKSSSGIPQLSQLDFAGLLEHMAANSASGCLLIAPGYPAVNDDASAVSNRARELRISCWTIEQLARVVEATEVRHINAKQVLGIVTAAFAPIDVTSSVDRLFEDPAWDKNALATAVLDALEILAPRLTDTRRNVGMVAAVVSGIEGFDTVSAEDVRKAVIDLAHASSGTMLVDGDDLVLLTSIEEFARRVRAVTGARGKPRRPSNFRRDLAER